MMVTHLLVIIVCLSITIEVACAYKLNIYNRIRGSHYNFIGRSRAVVSQISNCNLYRHSNSYPHHSRLSSTVATNSDGISNDIVSSNNDFDNSNSSNKIISKLQSINRTNLWGRYSISLGLKPVLTKSISSFVGFVVGDILSQVFLRNAKVKMSFSLIRCLRMGSFGALVHGPLGHLFYGYLEKKLPGPAPSVVASKVLIDQLVWVPLFSATLLSYVGITVGASPNGIFNTGRTVLPHLIISSWLIWPVTHYINFKYISANQRLLFINTAQIIFNLVVSYLVNVPFVR